MSTHTKLAIVTGASEGIGFTIAQQLIADGYHVATVARQEEKLRAATDELGSSATPYATDLSDVNDIEVTVAQVVADFGRIDALVNCASTTQFGSAIELTDEQWVSGFQIKVFGALRMIRAVWPHITQHGGNIINIGGIGCKTPQFSPAMSGPLSASLAAFTKAFADGGTAHGVRVNQINPGGVLTPRFKGWIGATAEKYGKTFDEFAAESAKAGGFTRFGTPEDVAGLVSFIMSEQGSWMQGSIIDYDGGITKGM